VQGGRKRGFRVVGYGVDVDSAEQCGRQRCVEVNPDRYRTTRSAGGDPLDSEKHCRRDEVVDAVVETRTDSEW
jgi:hypothetical protein